MDLTTQSEVIESIEENGDTLDNTSNIIELEKEKSKPRKNKEKSKEKPFRELGYDSGIYYLISKQQLQVLPFKARDLKESNLLQLAPLSWWRKNYPQYNDNGDAKKSPDWTLAADDIIQGCSKAGVYSCETVRGLGFWKDGDRVIHHRGNALEDLVNRKIISMLDPSLRGVYQRATAKEKYLNECATDEQIALFLAAVNRIYWKDEAHSQLFLGWLVLALFCGLLDWRPHIWVTGEHGAGKSDTVLEAVRIALGAKNYISAKGSTTEAGLRQRLKHNAIPAVVDESEPNTTKDRLRLDSLLTLARNASSDDEATAIKGTVSGEAHSYRIRCMFCFASINPYIKELADQSRISILEIVKKPQNTESKADFQFIKKSFLELEKAGFNSLLNNLMISRLATLESNIKVFVEAAGDILGSARDGKQYGTLLAGYATFIESEPVDIETAKSYVTNLKLTEVVEENRDTKATGWDECWIKMCAVMLVFRDSRSRVTVGEGLQMLETKNIDELAKIVGYEHLGNGKIADDQLKKAARQGQLEVERALRRLGIIYQEGTKSLYGGIGEGFYLANKNELMSFALSGTAFSNWYQHSSRVGQSIKKSVKFETARKVVFIPLGNHK